MEHRLKILFLTPRFPFPIIGGDRLKPYKLLEHLGKYHDVTLITWKQGDKMTSTLLNEITSMNIKVVVLPLDPIKAGLRALPLTLFAGFPLEIAFYNQPEYSLTVDKLLKNEKFDLAFSFFIRTAEYLKDKDIKKILIAEDCRTLYQQRSYLETSNIIQKLTRWWEYRKLRKYEPEIVNHFDVVSLVTNDDIEAMKVRNDKANYRKLTNGTDTKRYIPPETGTKREGILFASKMDIWANVLMIQRIVNDIYPGIIREVPGTILNFVGANPSKYINSLASDSIKITPDVPDMKPFLQTAQLFLHPHSGGTGIQNKLLEAMSCGCPVVTTPTGIQGIPATHGKDVMIGKNNRELTEHAITLLKNPELANEIGNNARKLMEEFFSWDVIYKELDKIIEEVIKL